MDLVLSEAAGLVQALAGLLESKDYPGLPLELQDILLKARYVPTLCTRAARWRDAVCVAPVVNAVETHDELTQFVARESVCAECGLSRSRLAVTVAGSATQFVPSHPLFGLAMTSREGDMGWDSYAAHWELDHACEGKGDAPEDVCYVPALAFLTQVFGDGTVEPQVAVYTMPYHALEKHIHACLHSLGKDQPWLVGHPGGLGEFAQPGEPGVCHEECRSWLSSLESEHGCCAPHLAAQHFAYSCSSAMEFQGSCMHFSSADADAVVAALGEVCDFAPAPCIQCGDTLDFVVPAPQGDATDLSAENTHVLAEALRSDLAAHTGEQIHVAIQALQLVTEEEGGYFLEAKIELGSAPCWRSKFVGEQLRAEVEKGTLSFPALSTALGHERHPVVAPPITANHSVYASIKLASADPAVYPRLRDELATLVAAEAQVPAAHVTVELRMQQAPQALLQRGRRSEPSALEPGAEVEAREPSLKEAVADISISGVASGRAQAVTGALVLSFAQGSVKAKLTEHGVSIKDSLVVHKPTIEGAKASLEELVHEREKQLAEAKEAQKAGEDLLNHDAKGAARRVEEVEGQVEDLEAKLKALEGATDAPPPSVETSPEPKTPPTASPPAEGTKVVEDVELSEADAGESAKLALPSSVHFNPTFTIAAVLISGSLAVVIGLLWFFGNLVPTYTANS
jgi:hypothetical protein